MRSTVTVAMLAQGTHWADALAQALLNGFDPHRVYFPQTGYEQLAGFHVGAASRSGHLLLCLPSVSPDPKSNCATRIHWPVPHA